MSGSRSGDLSEVLPQHVQLERQGDPDRVPQAQTRRNDRTGQLHDAGRSRLSRARQGNRRDLTPPPRHPETIQSHHLTIALCRPFIVFYRTFVRYFVIEDDATMRDETSISIRPVSSYPDKSPAVDIKITSPGRVKRTKNPLHKGYEP